MRGPLPEAGKGDGSVGSLEDGGVGGGSGGWVGTFRGRKWSSKISEINVRGRNGVRHLQSYRLGIRTQIDAN